MTENENQINNSSNTRIDSNLKTLEMRANELSLGRSGGLGVNDWDQNEVNVCLAMVKTALRLKSKARLESALNAFGGLPREGDKWIMGKPLDDAARACDAFGFEIILNAQQNALAGTGQVSKSEQDRLGDWLRTGLFNSYYGRHNGSNTFDMHRAKEVGVHAKPVATCLVHDNPVALAHILKDERRRAALASCEPKPMADHPDWSDLLSYSAREAVLKVGRKADAGFEKSLLWQAISMKAFCCAALLCELPDFNQPLLKSDNFGALSDQNHWFEHRANNVFEETGPVDFCFFEWAVLKGDDIGYDSEHYGARNDKKAWVNMLMIMSNVGDSACREYRQKGTDLGWPELFFVRTRPHHWGNGIEQGNSLAQKEVAAAMEMLNRFESNHFTLQWEALAEACTEGSVLKDWLMVKGVSVPQVTSPHKPRRLAL